MKKHYTNRKQIACIAAMLAATTLPASAQSIETSSSFAPRVISSYIPRGVDFALGRITVKGKNIAQQGFCYSDTNPEPTIKDSVANNNIWDHNGTIYRMEGLKPTTIYYIRAYAINNDGEVGYSPVQKICTLKESNATYTYDFAGNAEQNERIDKATAEAIRYYHKATNFQGYEVKMHYVASVPTADCSYGGYIRMGQNSSYQATGTVLHEMNHGVGVGQHSRWMNDADLRSGVTTGNWLGVRANKVVQFFDNNETAVLKGDNQHMWPYGINGAQEDTHSEILYTANVMITQALAEDGLPPTYDMGNGAPSMVFDPQPGVKYYIKSECPGLGFEHGFLADENKEIVWKDKTSAELAADDTFAWYINFDPVSSRYTFQNVGTGNYITCEEREGNYGYLNDFLVLNSRTEIGDKELLQLLGSRKDVTVGKGFSKQSYWMFYPRTGGYWGYDPVLQAEEGGATQSTTNFAFGNRNTNQRWLYLTASEVEKFEAAMNGGNSSRLVETIEACKAVLAVPHEGGIEAEGELQSAIAAAEQYLQAPVDTISMGDEVAMLQQAVVQYIPQVTLTDINKPIDLTFLIGNASLAENTDEWAESPTYAAGVCEYYSEKIGFTQKMPVKLPAGTYALHVQGFQRPGALATCASTATNANLSLYTKNEKIKNIAEGAQDQPLDPTDIQVDGKYIPNTMAGAAKYFEAGLYDNVAYLTVEKASSVSYSFGVKASTAKDAYWTCFKDFSLLYYGSLDPTGIDEVKAENPNGTVRNDGMTYDLQGRRVSNPTRGIYIRNGRKVMISE